MYYKNLSWVIVDGANISTMVVTDDEEIEVKNLWW